MKKKLASAALFSLISKGLNILSMLLLTPVILGVIGKEQYGLWILILSIIAWFNVLLQDMKIPRLTTMCTRR